MHKAASAYMQTHVTTTTPGHLVVMLYDGAISFLEQAKGLLFYSFSISFRQQSLCKHA